MATTFHCADCGALLPAGLPQCPYCGAAFGQPAMLAGTARVAGALLPGMREALAAAGLQDTGEGFERVASSIKVLARPGDGGVGEAEYRLYASERWRPLSPAQGMALLGLEVHLASFDYHRAGLLLELRDATGAVVYRHPAYAAAVDAPSAAPAVPERQRQLAMGPSHELALLPGMAEAVRAAASSAGWLAALGAGCLGALVAWGVLIVGAAARSLLDAAGLPGGAAVTLAAGLAGLAVLTGGALAGWARRRRTLAAASAEVERGTFTRTRGPLAPVRSAPGRRRPDVLVLDGGQLRLRGANRGLGSYLGAMAFATCDHGPLGIVLEVRDIDDRAVYRLAGYPGAPEGS